MGMRIGDNENKEGPEISVNSLAMKDQWQTDAVNYLRNGMAADGMTETWFAPPPYSV